MTIIELVAFVRRCKYATVATIAGDGSPQAAVVGIAIDDDLTIVFDTSNTSRKFANLERDGRVAIVAFAGEATAQMEGDAMIVTGDERAAAKAIYFASFPDGRDREAWPDIAYVSVRLTWIRYSDFAATGGPAIVEVPVTRRARGHD